MARDLAGNENQLPTRNYVEREVKPEIKSLPERRDVICVKKNADGDILGLGNPHAPWFFVASERAIGHIGNGLFKYYVSWKSGADVTEIKVVQGSAGKYLRADRDQTTKNNLDELPDCP